jgi:hypothetical protein
MAIQVRPTANQQFIQFLRYYRPPGSQTVIWAEELNGGRMYHLLQWGNKLYLPVLPGDRFGIGVYNGSRQHIALPAYAEARNIWDGGPPQPEDCTPDYMWELEPYQRMVIDALMNPNEPVGRPFIIVGAKAGISIGQASFGSNEFRAQFRLYQRSQVPSSGVWRRVRDDDDVLRGATPMERGAGPIMRGGEPEDPFNANEEGMRGVFLGSDDLQSAAIGAQLQSKDSAAIGAGAQETRRHHYTGVRYQRAAELVAALQIEYSNDLREMLNRSGINMGDFYWPKPQSNIGFWWDQPVGNWSPPTTTAKDVPIADDRPSTPPRRPGPHIPRRDE